VRTWPACNFFHVPEKKRLPAIKSSCLQKKLCLQFFSRLHFFAATLKLSLDTPLRKTKSIYSQIHVNLM
jgi:hypothetical protein